MKAFVTEYIPAFLVGFVILVAAEAMQMPTVLAYGLCFVANIATLAVIEKVKG